MATGIAGDKRIRQTSDATFNTDSIENVWRTGQHTAMAWWSRWQQEYLKELRGAFVNKGINSDQLKEEDVVLIEEKKCWALGGLSECKKKCMGRDGLPWACMLRTIDKNKSIRRALQLLHSLKGCLT